MSESLFKSSQSTTTILGMYNQFHSLVNMPYETYPETTINTKRNLFPAVVPTKVPTIKYFGIGLKGFYNVDDGVLSQPYKPKATNMDLHQPIPFRCVPVDSDLDAVTRAKYRIRTRQTINGEDYFLYWLKLITFIDNRVKVTHISADNEETPYVFDPTNLNPQPTKIDSSDIVDTNANRVVVSVTGRCTILGAEIAEIINIMFGGDFRYSRVSEFGFYTGEDQSLVGVDKDGNSLQYTDAIYTQLATHRCTLGTDLSDETGTHEENIIYESGSMLLL